MTRLSAADIRGVVGIVPTPAKEGANRWDAVQTVNLEETARMVEALVEAGIDVIMTNGTFGEGASLTWDEVQAFVDTIVQVVRKRVPVFAGATTLNTRDTIARGRALRDLGADGLFVGRPMWMLWMIGGSCSFIGISRRRCLIWRWLFTTIRVLSRARSRQRSIES